VLARETRTPAAPASGWRGKSALAPDVVKRYLYTMRRTNGWLIAAIATALMLSGCGAKRGGDVPYDRTDFGPPDQQTAAIDLTAQPIVPTDKLSISVFQEPDLTGEFVVDPEGRIDFPLLGQLAIEGRTPAEVSEMIRSSLSESYLRDPKVQVAVLESAERSVTVEGAVTQSGVYPIAAPITLIRSIALARGTTRDANDARVLIFRTVNGQRMAAAFDLTAIRKAEAPDPPVYGNDVVVVPGSGTRAFWRDVIQTLPAIGIFRPF
jgi:polysaccharide export outer membrane protein